MKKRFIPGQPVPNFQQQLPGPAPAIGTNAPWRGQRTRNGAIAPFANSWQPLPQQHKYFYRLDPSGAGPGGLEVNTPAPKMGILGRVRLALFPPSKQIALPKGPWLTILDSQANEG